MEKLQENRNSGKTGNTMEGLVPDFKLCEKIPTGKFQDSALVWDYKIGRWTNQFRVRKRELFDTPICPAPTLAEIMKELPKYDEKERVLACVPDFGFNEDGEMVYGDAWQVGYCKSKSGKDANPAAAALKLWLELNDGNGQDRQDGPDGQGKDGVE